ncbi:MAG: hypothetical protein E7345_00390 [Clostridiales bacterium]|nr:hypothetical protein [Clostridiales bacterium]
MDKIIENNISKNSRNKAKFDWLSKLSPKYIKIAVLIIVVIISFVLYLNLSSEKNIQSDEVSSTYISTLKYSEEIENKLENILGKIDGAGDVDVMVSLDGSPEMVYATDSDSKTSSTASGTTTTTSSNIIVVNGKGNSEAILLKENLPKVKGVIVVSSGADNIQIKLDILNAVSTLLDISVDKINVLKGI